MSELRDKIDKAVKVIREKSGIVPEAAIILGSGLGGLAQEIDIEAEISYEDIPDFPVSTVEFHAGKLLMGRLSGKNIAAMQGRFHIYEGYTMQQIAFPVRTLKLLGAETLIISNVCGGLNPDFDAGDIMIINDHINLLGGNPLIGANDNSIGPRYPDMSEPYSRKLIALTKNIADEENIKVREGVYTAMTGPSLETAAEYRMLGRIGSDAIGMSTVPEVITGVHAGMKILGLSVITDMCIPETLKPANIDEIIKIAGEAEPKLTTLIKKVVERL
ncbi:purine-nucleoside phosphorylase [candidate division KSB1 bacterium]